MLKTDKVKFVKEMQEALGGANGFVVADFKGLTVQEFEGLRKEIRKAGSIAKVIKNRLLKLALNNNKIQGIDPFLKQNTVLIYSKDDIFRVLKLLVKFAKVNRNFSLKGGFILGKACDAEMVKELSHLPGRIELIAMVTGALTSVIGNFAGVLNSLMTTFNGTIEALAKKKA